MGFLDSFERSVERLVGGAFAKAFSSGVHPIEIVAGLKKEMDSRAKEISRTRILAPHIYYCGLGVEDHARLTSLGDGFSTEIVTALNAYAKERGYGLAHPLSLNWEVTGSLSEGMIDIRSDTVGKVVWIPTLTWDSVRYPLIKKSTVIGRGTDSDIHVVAKGVSRHHAEVRWDGKRAEVVDLGSTNGTKLDGSRIKRAALPDKCALEVGQARILFEVVPQTEADFLALAHHNPVRTKESS
ncbi:MAG: hypothetical protein RL247_626 [Actinomycetota bacterium]